MEEAESAQLILPSPARREARNEFTHALVRQTLLEKLSMPRLQRLHLGIADAMEAAYGDRAADYAPDIATSLDGHRLLGGEVLLTQLCRCDHALRADDKGETGSRAIDLVRRQGSPWEQTSTIGVAVVLVDAIQERVTPDRRDHMVSGVVRPSGCQHERHISIWHPRDHGKDSGIHRLPGRRAAIVILRSRFASAAAIR